MVTILDKSTPVENLYKVKNLSLDELPSEAFFLNQESNQPNYVAQPSSNFNDLRDSVQFGKNSNDENFLSHVQHKEFDEKRTLHNDSMLNKIEPANINAQTMPISTINEVKIKPSKLTKVKIKRALQTKYANNHEIELSEVSFEPMLYFSNHNNYVYYISKGNRIADSNTIDIINPRYIGFLDEDTLNSFRAYMKEKKIKIYKNTDIYFTEKIMLLVYGNGKIIIFAPEDEITENLIRKNKKKLYEQCIVSEYDLSELEYKNYCRKRVNIFLVLAYFPYLIDSVEAMQQLSNAQRNFYIIKGVRRLIYENTIKNKSLIDI
ncbi:hypothetical protein COBT_000231 [Conglomerata obtusa]